MEKKYKVIRNFLSDNDLEILSQEATKIKYRQCPPWLGNFSFKIFNQKSGPPSENILFVAQKLVNLVDDQTFNVLFMQKYEEGEEVYPHIDPRNNVGYTVIAPFGNFKGAISRVEEKQIKLNPGDVLVQQCTMGYSMGPKHSVSAVEEGTRYALILNTIVENNTFEK